MKVITIRQPFASLIALGLKEYEFRTWKTHYRGEILIHAGKSMDKEAVKKFSFLHLTYPTGCIIAKANLTDCIPVTDAVKEELREKNFLVYSGTTESMDWNGYGFKLENIETMEPIFVNGMLGLWEYDFENDMGDPNEGNKTVLRNK